MKLTTVLIPIATSLLTGGAVLAIQDSGESDHPERYEAALELMQTMQMEVIVYEAAWQEIERQMEANPATRQFEEIYEIWLRDHANWKAYERPFAELYAEVFTLEDLILMSEWYATPTGLKSALLTPTLAARGAVIGEQIALEHLPALTDMIEAKLLGEDEEDDGEPDF